MSHFNQTHLTVTATITFPEGGSSRYADTFPTTATEAEIRAAILDGREAAISDLSIRETD